MDFAAIAMDALVTYGLFAVFLLIFLDGALLMPGLPGELVLILYITFYQPDLSALFLLGGIAVAASMLSAIPLYMVGRATARNMTKKKKRVFGMSPKMQERMQRLFSRPLGAGVLVFARLFLPTRAIVSIPAGIARMPFTRFMLLSLLGTTVFIVAFIWLIYEFQDPDSQLAQTRSTVDEAYTTPAWGLVEANWILAVVALVILGVVLSIRASRRMAREAHETSGSIIGYIVRTALMWGGAVVFVAVWVNNRIVYDMLARSGIHPEGIAIGLPGEPDTLIALVALLAFLLGFLLRNVRKNARKANRRLRLEQQKQEFQKRLPTQLAAGEHEPDPDLLRPTKHGVYGTRRHRRHPLVRAKEAEAEKGKDEAQSPEES